MHERRLDDDPEEFRLAAHQAVEWIADYLTGIRQHPVLSSEKPGSIRSRFADTPSLAGTDYEQLLEKFRADILPGITHWNHPRFFAYFSITGSQAGVLGELLCSALNVNGMLWKTSPAVTELEQVVLGWLRDALGLPPELFGIINDTASINTFLALAAAREATGLEVRERGLTGRTLPLLRIYCSDQAHSSVDKAALALGFGKAGVARIASDEQFRMRPEALADQMAQDRASGHVPVAIVATLGTTSTGSVDPLPEIAEIAASSGAWLHVDASYAGSAAISPRFRDLWRGIERADSLVINPHKWLFTQVDCSVLYTRRPDVLKQTFSLVAEYLQTSEEDVVNYMDYGLQLGRRFRALKLWLVLEHYGLERLARRIEEHCEYAKRLAAELARRDDIELLAPPSFSVVVFRRVVRRGGVIDEPASERATTSLLETINDSGRLFVSHTRLSGKLAIRVAIGNGATLWTDVAMLLEFLEQATSSSVPLAQSSEEPKL